MTLIRLIVRLAACRHPDSLGALNLMVLAQAVQARETTEFPAFPIVNAQADFQMQVYEKFKQGVLEACQKFVKSSSWHAADQDSYHDFHPITNYNPCNIPTLKLRDEFQPTVITDMSNDCRDAVQVTTDKPGMSISEEELKMFGNAPLLHDIVTKHLTQETESSKQMGRPETLPYPIVEEVCSPCEIDALKQMSKDVETQFAQDVSKWRMVYLRSKEIQELHQGVVDPTARDRSAEVLADALDQLSLLQAHLEKQRDDDAECVHQGRASLEEFANRGTAQLHNDSIRLRFEFMVAAMLQMDANLQMYNSKLTAEDSKLIFHSLTGVLFRSIRLAQCKFAINTLISLKQAIQKLIAAMIEEKWVQAQSATLDKLPFPTKEMVRHCLEFSKYRKKAAEEKLRSLLEAQQRIADLIEREQHIHTEKAGEAARLLFHLANFVEEDCDTNKDGEMIVFLGQRGCCMHGRSLFFPRLSE
eukprot:CAMPEP_0175165130 /NCGR_PEP_ID=MMETSP0087-20121206/26876_1 /TAXON_ID=136419 /ORGANISM="Unknown Unknown, Strain D1" /LENGTH=472 /DNA_ID=CAMNT_0016454395 /DNA_START=22 /DNA_END=1437 /DNA_ORIENTATION=+